MLGHVRCITMNLRGITVQHRKACHLFTANVIMKNYMEKDCHQDLKVKTAL